MTSTLASTPNGTMRQQVVRLLLVLSLCVTSFRGLAAHALVIPSSTFTNLHTARSVTRQRRLRASYIYHCRKKLTWLSSSSSIRRVVNVQAILLAANDDDNSESKNESKPKSGRFLGSILKNPFGRNNNSSSSNGNSNNSDQDEKLVETATATATAGAATNVPISNSNQATTSTSLTSSSQQQEPDSSPPVMTAAERAARLRAQAEKARLEADQLDAALTLQKIDRLERELTAALQAGKNKRNDTMNNRTDDDDNYNNERSQRAAARVADLQRQMESLQARVRGEAAPPPSTSPTLSAVVTATRTATGSATQTSSSTVTELNATGWGTMGDIQENLLDRLKDPFDPVEFNATRELIEKMPGFILRPISGVVEMDPSDDNFNRTEMAVRVHAMLRGDFASYSTKPPPRFAREQIQARIEEIRQGKSAIEFLPNSNETEKALMSLEYEYYVTNNDVINNWVESLKENKFMQLINATGDFTAEEEAYLASPVGIAIASLYPKCTRKNTTTNSIPSAVQMEKLVQEVLPVAKFMPSSKPERVLGGYILRGIHRSDNGNALLDAIDSAMAQTAPGLQDQMTVLYTNDFTVIEDEDRWDLEEYNTRILYIIGPDICREPRRVQLSILTAAGLATSWYMSIVPTLINPIIADKVNEQLAFADAGGGRNVDLNFITEMAMPLFVTFIGLQLIHEAGHFLAARVNGFKSTAPVFVPSLITGITSAVTTFRSPPKNRDAMFDFAVAGPLAGSIASIVAIAIGCIVTLTMDDTSLLPALPIELLRQSTLGGSVIESILGNGVLSIPGAAMSNPAVAAMTIRLHPVAIAGYVSLMINALSLIPIGTTDGGRIALTLFGRILKPFIGNFAFFLTLLAGIAGADLFLFYFAFCIAFQTGNEIPARNEVDSISFSRVVVATITFGLAILTLVPLQQV